MNLMKSILFAGAVAIAGTAASASTVQNLSYANIHGQNVRITASPVGVLGSAVPSNGREVWAGAFTMTNLANAAEQFLAFCLDVRAAIQQNGFYTETDNPFAGGHDISGRVGDLQRLFDTGFQTVFDKIEAADVTKNLFAAAFQVAAWEILYEDDPANYDASNGDFAISNANVVTQANSFLGNLGGTVTQKWDLTFLQKSDAQGNPTVTGQNLVTGSPAAPIPLPAAGWLLIGGLGALAALRRRRAAA